jgi:hypothetical protein
MLRPSGKTILSTGGVFTLAVHLPYRKTPSSQKLEGATHAGQKNIPMRYQTASGFYATFIARNQP